MVPISRRADCGWPVSRVVGVAGEVADPWISLRQKVAGGSIGSLPCSLGPTAVDAQPQQRCNRNDRDHAQSRNGGPAEARVADCEQVWQGESQVADRLIGGCRDAKPGRLGDVLDISQARELGDAIRGTQHRGGNQDRPHSRRRRGPGGDDQRDNGHHHGRGEKAGSGRWTRTSDQWLNDHPRERRDSRRYRGKSQRLRTCTVRDQRRQVGQRYGRGSENPWCERQ